VVNGSKEELVKFLEEWRDAVQKIIDDIWPLDKVPTDGQLHQLYYKKLREHGFSSHHAKQIYKYAKALVKSAKANKGSKPQLRKLSARLDKYDVRLDLANMVVQIRVKNNKFVTLKLLHNKDYVKKFLRKDWYEVMVKVDEKEDRIWVCIAFKFKYEPYVPKRLVSVDINKKLAVVYDGCSVRRVRTRFEEADRLRDIAESIQKKHPYAWRTNPKYLNMLRACHRRSRAIVEDWCWKFAKWLVTYAKKISAAVVIEKLEGLWHRVSQRGGETARKLSRFAYRKFTNAVFTKCIEYNVPLIYVEPEDTSKTCPRCGAKLIYVHRLGVCLRCGFVGDRDRVAAMNILFRALYAIGTGKIKHELPQ